MAENLEFFWKAGSKQLQGGAGYRPLADRLRPGSWDDFRGLEQIDRNLIARLRQGRGTAPSLILWGPPGSGKTTIARLIGSSYDCNFVEFSAVLGGVKDVREIIAQARKITVQTILFVDEIHRFNKAQQDAFLPHVESGTIILIGATTENPSFYLNSALLSRLRVLTLPALSEDSLKEIVHAAEAELKLHFSNEAVEVICGLAGGDARQVLNFLENFSEVRGSENGQEVSAEEIRAFLENSGTLFYDRAGEEHYNMASAFIKSMRGSDPDAALFWGFRMIESGEDPRFIIRRMMIFASEDIGNADPRALQVAISTSDIFEKIGLPEGRIPIAQCITYLACAPKSNRSYSAMHSALREIKEHRKVEVPLHLRNAPTALMKNLGYGEKYLYPHDQVEGYAANVSYLPPELEGQKFYFPSERGYEKRIKERMDFLRSLDDTEEEKEPTDKS